MREKKKPKKSKVRKWCPGGGKEIGCDCHNVIYKYVRCSICDQRFEPYYRNSFCESFKIFSVPKHKAY